MTHLPQPAEDQKAAIILQGAAKVFSAKGYHNASMRDIARETGISLAGMYYYYSSKSEMLYSIQKFCFQEVTSRLRKKIATVPDPHDQLRLFIENHVEFFIGNVREMKVLSHESDSLTGEHHREITGMKREYFRALCDILAKVPGHDWDDSELRRVGLAIFGMVNWIYTWYDPQRDGTAAEVSASMVDLVQRGLRAPH